MKNKKTDEELKEVTGGNIMDVVLCPVQLYDYFCKVEYADVVDPPEIYLATEFETQGDRTYLRGTMYYQSNSNTYVSSGMSGCFLYNEIAKAILSGNFSISR